LTGLANRRRLDAAAAGVASAADGLLPYSVIALDIDHFKSYNDRFGHAAGDEALRVVAGVLRAGTRSGDLVARTGGEEFLVAMPGTGSNEIQAIAERLRRAIAEYPWPFRKVTASFGVATASIAAAGRDHDAVLEAADAALYESKRAGRNRVTRGSLAGGTAGEVMPQVASSGIPAEPRLRPAVSAPGGID
jgi:two-component system, cell cycle response regulator